MNSSVAMAESVDRSPIESDVSQLGHKPRETGPVTLIFDETTFVNTSHELCVAARSPQADSPVDVVLNYVPDGVLHFDQFYIDGNLRLVVGFVPENARRAIIHLFRNNKTLTLW